jgi:hypothetical protein
VDFHPFQSDPASRILAKIAQGIMSASFPTGIRQAPGLFRPGRFRDAKERLPELTLLDPNDLTNQVRRILTEIYDRRKIRPFDHGIERWEFVAEHHGAYFHMENNLADLIFLAFNQRRPC